MPLMVAARIIEHPEQFGLDIPEYAPWLVSNFELHSFPKEKTTANLRGTMWFTAAKGWATLLRPTSLFGLPVLNARFLPPTPRSITIRHKPSAASCLKQATKSCSSLPPQDLLTAYGEGFWWHVSHVDITVRGHGMSVPKPGYLSNEALLKIRNRILDYYLHTVTLSSYSGYLKRLCIGVWKRHGKCWLN